MDNGNPRVCFSLRVRGLLCPQHTHLPPPQCLNLESIIIWSDVLDTFEVRHIAG